jgi:hypothetical protein
MGCWNKTCGLSNLHITAGTPVYVFVLEKNKDYDHCYSTSLFTPLLLPFESTYDDYGGGEDSSGIALNIIMGGIKRDLVELEVGENQYHDIEVKKEGFTPEKFFEAVHEDRLSIKGRFSVEPTQLYFTMMRKDIVDNILENRTIEEYVGENKGTFAKWGDEKNYIRYKFADIVADIRPLLNEAMEKIAEAKATNDTLANYMLYDGFEGLFPYGHPNKVAKWLRGDSYRYSRIVDMKSVIRRGLEVGTVGALENLALVLEQHLKALYIDGFMHSARKTWIPGGHEGSQSTSGGALRLLAKATIDVLDEEKRQWMADMGEDADEEEYLED